MTNEVVEAVAKAICNADPTSSEWDVYVQKWGTNCRKLATYRRMAQEAIEALELTAEYRTCEDGAGGVTHHTDGKGNTISTTSGRSPTEMRRWVTKWEIYKEAEDYSYTVIEAERWKQREQFSG